MAHMNALLLLLAAALVAVVAVALAWLRHLVKRHSAGPLVWRWVSGHPLDGYHRTNATWSRRATKVLHPTGHAVRWHHLPRMYRAAIRTGSTAAAVLLAWGLVAHRAATLLFLGAAALATGAVLGWRVYYLTRHWRHHWTWHRPLHRALTPVLGGPPERLAIEPDRSRVVVGLPAEFTASDRDREEITRAVTAKLAIEAPDADWKLDGNRPQVTFTRSEPPPAKVTLPGILRQVGGAAEHELVLGLGKRSEPVVVSVDGDSPHLGLSMGSGDGKSTVARNIACQLLHHGAIALVLDYKLISHMWARGLPNVAYAGTPAEITTALLWLQDEIQRRNQAALAGADIEGNVHGHIGHRILVIAEELNATQSRLAAYWRTIREKGDPARSPASEALDEAMFIGRQVLCNVLQIGQRLSAKASGSGDARENLGVRIMHDPSPATWKMLGGDHALPPASGHLGRLQVVTARQVRETQGAFVTAKEARAFATSGTIAVPPPGMPFVAAVAGGHSFPELPHGAPGQPVVIGPPVRPPGLVTLREAVEAGLYPSLDAARKAANRDPAHPPPAGEAGPAHLYDINALYAYRAAKVSVNR